MKGYEIAIAIFALILQGQILTAELRNGQWRQYSAKGTDLFGPLYFSRSRIACGLQCSNYPGCYIYCYNDVTSTCYFKTKRSLESISAKNEAVRCYKQRCAFKEGYISFAGRCIQFFIQTAAYQTARQKCEQNGTHLYHFKTNYDRQPLINVMRDNGLGPSGVWIGADDLKTEGSFVWSDGDVLSTESDLWAANNPDNGKFPTLEHCVQVDNDYLFNDKSCSSKLYYICQLDL